MTAPDDLTVAARALVSARYVVALVGAGISVESGIPPFRGAGGLWTKHGEPAMDGYERFLADPAAHWQQMLARRESDDEFVTALRDAQPNAGHVAMARLEVIGVLKHTISQNIDDLHFRAGSVAVTEIHGNRTKVRCIGCGRRGSWDDVDASSVPPVCGDCGGVMKGDTVMFGEPIPRAFLDECDAAVERADCMLIAGTSASVFPAASYPEYVLQRGGKLVEVNIESTPLTRQCAAVLHGPSAVLLPQLVQRVEELLAEPA